MDIHILAFCWPANPLRRNLETINGFMAYAHLNLIHDGTQLFQKMAKRQRCFVNTEECVFDHFGDVCISSIFFSNFLRVPSLIFRVSSKSVQVKGSYDRNGLPE